MKKIVASEDGHYGWRNMHVEVLTDILDIDYDDEDYGNAILTIGFEGDYYHNMKSDIYDTIDGEVQFYFSIFPEKYFEVDSVAFRGVLTEFIKNNHFDDAFIPLYDYACREFSTMSGLDYISSNYKEDALWILQNESYLH